MRSQASNTDKELKKDKFGTANHADTIQPKSMDGLQNHADTQKLTQFKTAAEQSNRHEKLTQLQSMGDARSHKIQNGGVVQLNKWRIAMEGAKSLGGGAARAARRQAPAAISGFGGAAIGIGAGVTGYGLMGAVNTAADVADKYSEILANKIVRNGDKNIITKNTIDLAKISVDKSALPDFIKEPTTTFLNFIGGLAPEIQQRVQSGEGEVSNLFKDDNDRVISEAIRQYSSIIDESGFTNPLAALISIDNMRSRYIALIKIIKDEELVQLKHEDEMKANAAHTKLKKQDPAVAAFNRANEGKKHSDLFDDSKLPQVIDVDW